VKSHFFIIDLSVLEIELYDKIVYILFVNDIAFEQYAIYTQVADENWGCGMFALIDYFPIKETSNHVFTTREVNA